MSGKTEEAVATFVELARRDWTAYLRRERGPCYAVVGEDDYGDRLEEALEAVGLPVVRDSRSKNYAVLLDGSASEWING